MVRPVGCGKLAPHPPPLSPRSAYVVPCARRRAGTPRAAQYPLRVGHESPQTTEEGDLLLGKGSVLLVGRVILFPRRRRSRERFGGARASDLGVTSTGSPDCVRAPATGGVGGTRTSPVCRTTPPTTRRKGAPAGVARPELAAKGRGAAGVRRGDRDTARGRQFSRAKSRPICRSCRRPSSSLGSDDPSVAPSWIDSKTLSRNDRPRSIPFDKIRRVSGHPSFEFRALVRGDWK